MPAARGSVNFEWRSIDVHFCKLETSVLWHLCPLLQSSAATKWNWRGKGEVGRQKVRHDLRWNPIEIILVYTLPYYRITKANPQRIALQSQLDVMWFYVERARKSFLLTLSTLFSFLWVVIFFLKLVLQQTEKLPWQSQKKRLQQPPIKRKFCDIGFMVVTYISEEYQA